MDSESSPTSVAKLLHWLTPRRLRAQAIVLALCLWTVCVVDFSTPGLFDRAGNIKFQDFLPVYVSARLIRQHQTAALYDANVQARELQAIVGANHPPVVLTNLYPPQVALLFAPIAGLPFLAAASLWTVLSVLIYFACVYAIWNGAFISISNVIPSEDARPHSGRAPQSRDPVSSVSTTAQEPAGLTLLAAVGFPPLFHAIVRGQLPALALLCFTAALLCFVRRRRFLAGFCIGLLLFKPSFVVAIPFILLFAGAWPELSGLILSAGVQFVITYSYFGRAVMQSYFDLLTHPARWMTSAELNLAPIQMHSFRSFWQLLVPYPAAAMFLYLLSAVLVVGIAARIWRSNGALALRFSALILAAVLVDPHLFVYDLLVLVPALLLLVDWSLANRSKSMAQYLLLFSWLLFILFLIGPISRWTHIQLSVLAMSIMLWLIYAAIRDMRLSSLAAAESSVI